MRTVAFGKMKLRFCATCGEKQANNWAAHQLLMHLTQRNDFMMPLEEGKAPYSPAWLTERGNFQSIAWQRCY